MFMAHVLESGFQVDAWVKLLAAFPVFGPGRVSPRGPGPGMKTPRFSFLGEVEERASLSSLRSA
jgi:hypothetical protein